VRLTQIVRRCMHASKVIDQILREYLVPLMKSHGFNKRGQRFWRNAGHVVDVLDLQKSQWNISSRAEFTINIGVFWPAINAQSEVRVTSLPPATCECTITERIGRLFGSGLDLWWRVRGKEDLVRRGQDVQRKVIRFALPWLESMHSVREMVAYQRRHPCLFDTKAVRRYFAAKRHAEPSGSRQRRKCPPVSKPRRMARRA